MIKAFKEENNKIKQLKTSAKVIKSKSIQKLILCILILLTVTLKEDNLNIS